MKLCQQHWDQLKDAIEAWGLMHLVVKNGEAATAMVTGQLQGDTSNQTFDPLMAANFAIWSNSLSHFGLGMMAEDAPCPLCYLTECAKNGCGDPNCTKQHDSGEDWIRYAADDQLNEARKRGLAPQPS